MLERTDTEWGPWTIVEATDRRWARVKIFETIIRRLEEALAERGAELPPEPSPESPAAADEDADSEDLDDELAVEAETLTGDQ
jgi:hypothetical protein